MQDASRSNRLAGYAECAFAHGYRGPLTTGRAYPFRPPTQVQGIAGVAATDQIRTVDKRRLVKCIGALDAGTAEVLLQALVELFAP